MDQRKRKQRKKAPNPGQRTLTGWILHMIAVILIVVSVLIGSVAVVGAVSAKVVYDNAKEYVETVVKPNANFSLDGIKLNQSSFILAYDKASGQYVEVQQLVAVENRVWVSFDEIPKDMINATVAIEDKRFWEHDGVDYQRTLAASANMFMGGSTYGGSTLTQQLIKNLTNEKDVTVRRKVTEIFRALEFEKHYSKEEIIQWYLNVIYLGEGAYGVHAAAHTYFGKDLAQLTTKECACIVGITNNPSMYDPYLHPVANEKRTQIILSEMLDQGMLTQEQYDACKDQDLHFGAGGNDALNTTLTCPSCSYRALGSAFYSDGKYICPNCGTEVDPSTGSQAQEEEEEEHDWYTYFEDQVVRDVIADLMDEYGYTYDYASQLVTTGGFRIYSTIDQDVQAVVDSIYSNPANIPETYSNEQMQSGIVVIDNTTGDIVAMYGGVGEKEGYLTLNRATQSRRPTGSSIKPVTVYGPALEYGVITPGSAYEDGPVMKINGRDWPQNESRTYSGWMVVNTGLCRSLNTIAVAVLRDLTPAKSFDFAKNQMGLYNLVDEEIINGREFSDRDYAPLALGQLTHGVTVREMAQAFATFPNKGVFREARTYTKVEDSNGKIILDNGQETHQAMSEHAAWYMTDMLVNAVKGGTGTVAALKNAQAAGKTGTSTSNQDRWFNGFTPDYTTAVWCGFDIPEEIRLKDSRNPACRLWKMVMERLQETKEYKKFAPPTDEALVSVKVCNHTGKLPGPACTGVAVTLFKSDVPTKVCNGHGGETITICHPADSKTDYLATDFCKQFNALVTSEAYMAMITDGGSFDVKPNTLTTKYLDAAKYDENGFPIERPDNQEDELDMDICPVHTAAVVQALQEMLDAYVNQEETTEETSEEPTESSSEETQPTEPSSETPPSSETDPTSPPPSSETDPTPPSSETDPTPPSSETDPTPPPSSETNPPAPPDGGQGQDEAFPTGRPGSDAWLHRAFRLLWRITGRNQ